MPLLRPRAARRTSPLPYVYLLPSVAVLFVFGLLPVLFNLVLSFFQWDPVQSANDVGFAGISNWLIAIADQGFGDALLGSLWFVGVSGVALHAAAIPLAVFLDQAFRRWRPTVLALYFLPFLTGGIVIWVIVDAIFSASGSGLANAGLTALGNVQILGVKPLALFFPTHPVRWWAEHEDALIVSITWWHDLGWNVLLYVTALQYVPRVLLEAARIDGAGPWQTLRHVIVPQLRPMIFFAVSLTVVWGLSGDADERRSLSGVLNGIAYGGGEFGLAAAMAVAVVLVLAGILYLLWSYVGGRPALPRTSRAPADAAPAATWGSRVFAWLRRTLAAPESRDPTNLRGFDGMRGVACLSVLVHHCCLRLDGWWSVPWLLRPLWILGLRTDMGVCIFIVLSGALLSTPFWERWLDGRGPPALGEYAVRRAARIVPGYWAALAASAALGLWAMPGAQEVARRFWAGATFTSPFHFVTFFPTELNPVLWSIPFEVLCYLLLPLLLLPMWRALPDRSPRRAIRWLAGTLIALQLAHLAIVAYFQYPPDEPGRGWRYGLLGGAKEWLPYWSPASFMTMFLLGGGAALAIAVRRRRNPARSTDFDRLAGWVLLAAWILYAVFGSDGNTILRQPYITPIFPAFVAFGLYAMQFGDGLPRGLDNRLFRWVGKHSFGLYLWHFPVMELLRVYAFPGFKTFDATPAMRDVGLWFLLSALVIAVSALLAWVSWHALEAPALRWARSRRVRPVVLGAEGEP